MINYAYLQYWKMDIKNIKLIEKLMKINLEEYMRTKDIKYIEFLNENMQKLLKLKQTTTKYYSKTNFKR